MEILKSDFLDKLYPEGIVFEDVSISDINFNSIDPSVEISFHS